MHTELFVIRMMKMLVISISVKNTSDVSVKEDKKEKLQKEKVENDGKYFG